MDSRVELSTRLFGGEKPTEAGGAQCGLLRMRVGGEEEARGALALSQPNGVIEGLYST